MAAEFRYEPGASGTFYGILALMSQSGVGYGSTEYWSGSGTSFVSYATLTGGGWASTYYAVAPLTLASEWGGQTYTTSLPASLATTYGKYRLYIVPGSPSSGSPPAAWVGYVDFDNGSTVRVASTYDAAALSQVPYGVVSTGGVSDTFFPISVGTTGLVVLSNGITGNLVYSTGANWIILYGGNTWTGPLSSALPCSGTYTLAGHTAVTLTAITAPGFETAPPASPITGSRDALLTAASAGGSSGGSGPNM